MAFAVSTACATGEPDTQLTRATIQQLGREMNEAANALDAAAFVRHFAADTGLVVAFDGQVTFGAANLLDAQRQYWGQLSAALYEVRDSRVVVVSPDVAIVTNTGRAIETTRQGDERRGGFVSTVVWQRRPEGWRVINMHESTSP
jgi:uncharacterized protein (TIGR02246 family)